MRSILLSILSILALSNLTAQEGSFNVEVTADTVYYGNPIQIKYTMINIQGDFQAPSFDGFNIIAGPNTSSQYSMVNGKVTQRASYEYVLMPVQEGVITIGVANLDTGEDMLMTPALDILVLDNPDGIMQRNQGYSYRQEIIVDKQAEQVLTKEDSLRIKLRKLKSTKI